MNPALIPIIGALVDKAMAILGKSLPDQAAADKLRADLFAGLMTMGAAELSAASEIIKAEAQGESWLQRNWRPILMLVIVSIVANNYLIAPYLNAMGLGAPILELPSRLWDLMTLGVGGYVAGRTVEKAVETWKR